MGWFGCHQCAPIFPISLAPGTLISEMIMQGWELEVGRDCAVEGGQPGVGVVATGSGVGAVSAAQRLCRAVSVHKSTTRPPTTCFHDRNEDCRAQ